jgi:hypothetical protein
VATFFGFSTGSRTALGAMGVYFFIGSGITIFL